MPAMNVDLPEPVRPSTVTTIMAGSSATRLSPGIGQPHARRGGADFAGRGADSRDRLSKVAKSGGQVSGSRAENVRPLLRADGLAQDGPLLLNVGRPSNAVEELVHCGGQHLR